MHAYSNCRNMTRNGTWNLVERQMAVRPLPVIEDARGLGAGFVLPTLLYALARIAC